MTKRDFNRLVSRANGGDVSAQFDLALRYAIGEDTSVDLAESFCWYRRAADNGDGYAAYHVGSMLLRGEGCKRSLVLARKYLRSAVEDGMGVAAMELGYLTIQGAEGVEDKLIKGVPFFVKAVALGDIRGLREISSLLTLGVASYKIATSIDKTLKSLGVSMEGSQQWQKLMIGKKPKRAKRDD